MNRNIILASVVLAALCLSSCSNKKESRTIITTIEKEEVSDQVKTVGDNSTKSDFDWNGTHYYAQVSRKADKTAKTVKDEDGNKYYDNTVTLKMDGPDGEVINRTFTKDDFSSYVNSDYIKPSRSTLLSIAFNRVDGGNAVFVATIGSPNALDDNYMCVQIDISKSGGMSMKTIQETE